MIKKINFDDFIKLEESFSNILFIEKNHSYKIDSELANFSVSGLIKKYEKEFDSQKIARFVAKKEKTTIENVLEKWDFSRDYSCHKGSEFHKFVENFLYRKQISIDRDSINSFFESRKKFMSENSISEYCSDLKNSIKNFINFYNWWKQDHILIKSEFVIGDKKSSVCGTIDNLSYNKKTNELVIFDYKTNKEIKRKNQYGEKLLYNLNHLDNCEYSKYSLQLSLYSTIIENVTSFEVPKSYIVWVSGKDGYELIECENLKKESQLLLDNSELNK